MKNRLITILLLATLTITSYSQKEETLISNKVKELDEVEVIGTRTKVASEKLRIVSTITRLEIANLPVQNISDLLEYLPGVDVRTRSGNGVQSDISMRGGTFDQVVILLNGVNITDPQTGHLNSDLPVDLNMIDKIEILQGTSMNIFGLSSFSGAINIITGSQTHNTTQASISCGDNGYIQSTLGANYGIGKWILTASTSFNQSQGYIKNTDYIYGNATLQAICRDTTSGNWNIMLSGQLKEFGANSFYSLKFPDQFEATKTLFGSLIWDKRFGNFGLEATLYQRTHQDRFELIREGIEAPAWYTFHNHHISNVSGINAKGAWFSRIGRSSIGIELRNENIISNVLGDPIQENIHVPGQPDSITFTHSKNRLNINYFAEQSFFINNFSASIGLSGNYNSMFKHNFAFGGNLGYEFVKGGTLHASINRGLRLPTFTDLYYKSATQIANPNLKPEENLTSEIGIKYHGHNITTNLNLYYRIGRNIIDWIKLPEEEQWKSMNHSKVDAFGGEFSFAYSYGYWLPKAEITYSYCNLNKKTDNYLSKYALDYLRHKLTLSIEHGIYKGFGANWQLTYQNRNGEYIDISGNNRTYKPVWLLDGQIYWRNKKLKLYVEATNITNLRYYDYGGIIQPCIWTKGGISIKI